MPLSCTGSLVILHCNKDCSPRRVGVGSNCGLMCHKNADCVCIVALTL